MRERKREREQTTEWGGWEETDLASYFFGRKEVFYASDHLFSSAFFPLTTEIILARAAKTMLIFTNKTLKVQAHLQAFYGLTSDTDFTL